MADISKPAENNVAVEADSTSQNVELFEDLSSGIHKKPKTYENRKLSESNSQSEVSLISITSSPCSDSSFTATSSPQNTSRYGRARKPKITEDFYNTEDIFGPYERIPCSPVRNTKKKLSTKLELSPNKSIEIINLDTEIIQPDLSAMLSIDIPDETIEVSKVMKIVSNNTSEEFSPKSPSFSKPVKTYSGKREKKTSETIFGIESFGLPDYPAGENCPYVNGLSHSEEDSNSESELETKLKINKKREIKKLVEKVPVELVNSNLVSDKNKSILERRTKFNALSLKTNPKSPVKNLIQSDNISTSTPNTNYNESTPLITSEKKIEVIEEINIKSLKNLNKNEIEDSNIIKNKFRVQKKPIPISRLKTNKLKQLKKANPQKTQKIHLAEKLSDDDKSEDESQVRKMKYETIEDLHKMYMPEVGDLTWSRVGSFPFWPSIVTKAPDTERHTRITNFGKKMTQFYHVNFFGDNGRRSWVLHTHIFPFHQRSDLEIMAKSVSKDAKPKEPRHLSAYIINPTKLIKWETAVTEAESLSEFPKDRRIKKFFEMVNPKKISKNSIKFPTNGKISKNIKINSKKLKKNMIKKIPNYFEDNSELDVVIKQEIIEDSYDDLNESFIRKTRKYRKRKSSIVSEDSFTDSEKFDPIFKTIEVRDTPSPVLSSSARHKKINLFKGISRDRVCQICGKNTNVYKCKGQCYGQYHIECDRKQKLRLPAACDDKTDYELLIGENIVGKKNIELEMKKEDESSIVASSIVEEILTNVFQKVLPEPTSIPNLSISEQIDLKMQEIMKNVVDTNYNDSTTDDSSSSDNETYNSENVAKSSVLSETKIPLSRRNSQITNSELSETQSEDTEISNKTLKVTKKLIKHVTADGNFDVIEEEIEPDDHSNFKCTYCSTGYKPPCFICNKDKSKTGDVKKHKCMTAQCGKYYHSECLKDWPQTKWYLSTKRKEIDNENLSCPYHNCHTCISDDPRGPLSRMTHEKLAKCIRCPTTYHINSYCIPAGTEILSTYQIICPKHLVTTNDEEASDLAINKKTSKIKLMHHVNASWCFICSMGGSLICCETCPSSFHLECLKLSPPEGRYFCEECESGRLPLFDEIVWVKLGAYRWWPAQILFPAEIPENVKNIAHNKGEFVVKFFGSHDHYWVNRGRVFLFQEGDTGHASSKKTAADRLFLKAIEEATIAHGKFVGARANRVKDSKNTMKPPSYIKIKVNKPVGDVRSTDADTSNTTPCDCDPNWDQPCGLDSDCLNRILLTECNPIVCAAGNRCCNQSFQNREYSPVEPFKTSARGWGLRTLVPVTKGTFVIEYVGEVINETEYIRRMKRKHEQKDENYYFLTIDKDRMIDAGPKGNVARFMNHSCSPNCETQKWTVNGDTRVGLFAIKDIADGAELTFNYNLECIGEEKKECRCGAPNCSGFIGVKAKQDEMLKKKKSLLKVKKKDKRKSQIQATKAFEVISCFVCGKINAIQQCDRETCNKFYHLECVNLQFLQEGRWFCPWHSCNICTKRTTRCCYMCINSYCPLHSEGYIRYDRVKGFICKDHDIPKFNMNSTNIQEDTKELTQLKKKYLKSRQNNTKTDAIKIKSIAELDLEEILKYDTSQSTKSNNIEKKHNKKKNYYEGHSLKKAKKKPKIMHERSLANLKQYREKLQFRKKLRLAEAKLQNSQNNSETKVENKLKTEIKEEIDSVENNYNSKMKDLEHKVEKSNGLYPEIKLETTEIKEENSVVTNQNNIISSKKRERQWRLDIKSDDSSEDDLPLTKRFKLHHDEIHSITKNDPVDDLPLLERLKMHVDEINGITKSMTNQRNIKGQVSKIKEESQSDNEKIYKSPKVLRSRSVSRLDLASLKSEFKKKDTRAKLNISAPDTNDSDFKFKKEIINKTIKTEDKNEVNTEIVVKRPRGRPRKYFPNPKSINEDCVPEDKSNKDFNKNLNECETKQNLNNIELNSSINNKQQIDSMETSSINISDSSQSIVFNSEASTDDQIQSSSKLQDFSNSIDFCFDAEEGIKKTVIDKETLHITSVSGKKSKKAEIKDETKDLDTEANKKNKLKRNKLSSSRSGIRKSSRISDPYDTSLNVSNSEFEISLDVNFSAELEENIGLPKLESTMLEVKRKRGRPKSTLKKNIFSLPVRKSNRFSKSEDINEEISNINSEENNLKTKDVIIHENKRDICNSSKLQNQNEIIDDNTVKTIDKTIETIDKTVETIDKTVETIDKTVETIDKTVEIIAKINISNKLREEDSSTILDETAPSSESIKRKRGRPRKKFPLVDIPKKPVGRPKRTKLIEEPISNVEEATELYKMKLNTEPKPLIPYENHINEIKLTTNVPERHLRVMLRKSEIESKAENKFLKMQNDIERDLPIRKRSKLRYETHS